MNDNTEQLGRFNHHPDPAIDYCIEVEEIQTVTSDILLNLRDAEKEKIYDRIDNAMSFVVGGDLGAVAAKGVLNDIYTRFPRPKLREWRCFHCDDVFYTKEDAAKHFGYDHMPEEPVCILNNTEDKILDLYREAQKELRAYRTESDAMSLQHYALGAEHARALIRAEEAGYAKGAATGNTPQFNDVVMCAFRYALGRRTHIVSTVAAYIARNASRLKKDTRETICKEISETLRNNPDIDAQDWQRLKTELEKYA